ncbi:hypothetical protein LINPERPRIM_LOCUS28024 [Linum perenne]
MAAGDEHLSPGPGRGYYHVGGCGDSYRDSDSGTPCFCSSRRAQHECHMRAVVGHPTSTQSHSGHDS